MLPWEDAACSSPFPSGETSTSSVATRLPNAAAKGCRAAAGALEKHITAKHDSANRMLAKPPTRKRLQEADSQRREAIRLERIQRTLRKLADMHENGSMVPELVSLTSRAAVERALFVESATSAIHVVYNSTDCPESRAGMVLRLSREAMLMGIPGFVPSPPAVAEELVRFADFGNPARVLEPSAGSGCLIDAVRERHHETRISYCEMNCFLLDLLRAKYEGSGNVHFIGRDFIELDISNLESSFDGIIMNPPFENGEDIAHVMHAHKFLSSKGILVAIVSEGAFHHNGKKTTAFRHFLATSKAQIVSLPAGAFTESGTEVRCRKIRIEATS